MVETIERTNVTRLDRNIRSAAALLPTEQVRFYVDSYYQRQKNRIESGNQIRSVTGMGPENIKKYGWHLPKDCPLDQAMFNEPPTRPNKCHKPDGKYKLTSEPHGFEMWLWENEHLLEKQISSALGVYAAGQNLGEWMLGIKGIGPVISAGLLANIDVTRHSTCGYVWRFAGYDPNVLWYSRDKTKIVITDIVDGREVTEAMVNMLCERFGRNYSTISRFLEGSTSIDALSKAFARIPWNKRLKVLCWKLGESFVKQQNTKDAFYGEWYQKRRLYEDTRNLAGDNAALAAKILDEKNIGKDTVAYKHYSQGKLPDGHIYSRAKRWTVKLFLSHMHAVGYEMATGQPASMPYVISFLGHSQYVPPPNWG